MPDKQQWNTLVKVFAEVFSRPIPETDSAKSARSSQQKNERAALTARFLSR
jgi:hypothetical protein